MLSWSIVAFVLHLLHIYIEIQKVGIRFCFSCNIMQDQCLKKVRSWMCPWKQELLVFTPLKFIWLGTDVHGNKTTIKEWIHQPLKRTFVKPVFWLQLGRCVVLFYPRISVMTFLKFDCWMFPMLSLHVSLRISSEHRSDAQYYWCNYHSPIHIPHVNTEVLEGAIYNVLKKSQNIA